MNAVRTSSSEALIEVSDLHRSFGAIRAVNGLSFTVERGQILGFLGPNGAGKSTTLKILTGYLAADRGHVRVAGFDVTSDAAAARQRFGYLPESLPLYPEMRVDEYLQFVAAGRGLRGKDLANQVDETIALLGLERMRKRATASLSKGFRQRVGLAQALLHDPEVLILDEPTEGLDPQQIIEVRELLLRLSPDRAIVFSSHILQEIAAICTHIIVIRDGRELARGAPEDLVAAEDDSPWELVVSGDLEEEALTRAVEEAGGTLRSVRRRRPGLEEAYLRLTSSEPARGRPTIPAPETPEEEE